MTIEFGSQEWMDFQEKANTWSSMSPNAAWNARDRIDKLEKSVVRSDAEATHTRAVASAHEVQLNVLKHEIESLTASLDKAVQAIQLLTDLVVRLSGEESEPMVQLDDDEFLAAVSDPEAYNRRLENADQRKRPVQPNARTRTVE